MSQQHPSMKRHFVALALLAAIASATATAAAADTIVFRGGTVHPVSGPPIEGAVMVVEDGRIAAVGAAVELPTGDGVEVIDVTGKHLYPGFVHPLSVLGLTEINSVRGTRDYEEIGDVNPELRAEVAWNADSLLLPVAVAGGVLTAHVVPRGGVFTGTSAVMQLTGWNWEDMTVAAPVGMHLMYPQLVSLDGEEEEEEEAAGEEKEKALRAIDQTLDDARAYLKAREAGAEGAPRIDDDPKLEALVPLLEGEMPLFLHADEKTQIESALDWAKEQGFGKIVLVAGSDVQYVAERLAEEGVPVILRRVLALPERDWEPYDAAYAAAAVLHRAGVRFAISDSGTAFEAANARNLPFHAAMAAAFGLPKDVALESVTLAAAEILGVGDRLGSLDPGKDATFLVTDGDPLEIRTRIERVWVGGREVDLTDNHQWRLYQKYRERPRPSAGGS
jgi:imidazolonepropionase-like amidohydrolase